MIAELSADSVPDATLGDVVVGIERGEGFLKLLELRSRAVDLDPQQLGDLHEFPERWTAIVEVSLDGVGILVFPLGSSAYSGSAVPLNRFDSIRLTLAFTDTPKNSSPYISITCVGETTALFKGGAASLAMY